ncbi:MAG: N-acetyl-alpha-D-glucosaminyl L-malate synthase BshA [Balneolaceae bacterium]
MSEVVFMNESMKIGIVCYPTFGGSGVVATELAKGLASRGHEVHMLSYARPARLDSFETRITYHEVDLSSYPLFEFPPYDLALANVMVNLIEHEKLDLLHVHYAIPHATSAYLAKQILREVAAHVPIITTLHGTDITIVGSDPTYKKVVDFSINQSDGVTAVSNYLRDETHRLFDIRKEIRVIANFIDLERFYRKDDPEFRRQIAPAGEKIVVHVSNFREVKRVPIVVSVFDRILKAGIPARLLMVGDGPDRNRAEQRCRDLGICDKVKFMGKQEHVEKILSVADLFVIPSGSETFGLAALEAMACGVPVISSNIGGLPEVNLEGKTGYLCELDDVETMGERSIDILSDSKLHDRMARAARTQAERFELSRLVTEYESYYREIRESM